MGQNSPFLPTSCSRVFALVSVVDLELCSLCPCQYCGFSVFGSVQEFGEQRPALATLKGSIYW